MQKGKKNFSGLMGITLAMILALISGIGLKTSGADGFISMYDTYFLSPVTTMFMNALKMLIGPVVFFSLASCIASFENLSKVGRLAGKTMLLYTVTTLMAISLGFGMYFLLQPGAEGIANIQGSFSTSIKDVSLLDTIVSIIPNNFLAPFVKMDTLQLVFMALLTGSAVSLMKENGRPLAVWLERLNQLFLKMVSLIVVFIPLVTYTSFTRVILLTGMETIIYLIKFIGTVLLTMMLMLAVYSIIILMAGRRNPLVFLRKFTPNMLMGFLLSSSSALIPYNLETCKAKLGIDKGVCSFTIPFGATINMDGNGIYMAVAGLMMAHLYGMTITPSMLGSAAIVILFLTFSTPGVPGAGLVCISLLFQQIGLPMEAVGLFVGIDTLMGRLVTFLNITGDAAMTTVVAATENAINNEVYYSR